VNDSLILRTTSNILMPLLVLFSLFVLLRGHNEPGGGFIGGLLAAAGLCLYLLAHGPAATRCLLRIDPRTLVGTGLLAALGSGLAAMLRGDAFLTGIWLKQPVPGIGKVSTVLLFDVGVYLVVAGTALLMVLMLADRAEQEDGPC
jgi:multicomponent Na+:H+ antiporter subunit B